MNLTAVTDEAEVMTRHVADSLAMLPPLERAYRGRSTSAGGSIDGVSLIDVGSGAGLPGLILAVARPSKHPLFFPGLFPVLIGVVIWLGK